MHSLDNPTLGQQQTVKTDWDDHPIYKTYKQFLEYVGGKKEIIMVAPYFTSCKENDKFRQHWIVTDKFLSGEVKLCRRCQRR